ncbi:alpha/beta hydrolase [Amycolatopsis sp. cg5]|uniref:alpha/beta hydrolase n=1 Tax=Amycolatopsis sp. cg5 TaxID=3238802 RepID=UPI0035234DF8
MTLDHKYLEGDENAPVLVLLHGTGGGPDDLLGLAKALSPASAVLAPAGPVSEHGAARWFRRLAEGVFDHEDVVFRANQLADFLIQARETYGLGGRRMIAVGFSNGANIAAAVTLLRPDALTEAIAIAAMSPVPEPPELDLHGTRVFLSNGERDPMAPLASTAELARALRERGAEVTEHRHPGGHQVTIEGVESAKEWIKSIADG